MSRPRAPRPAVRHPIQVVARRTGLSADVIRAWEKRYAVVAPQRDATGRRLYSDADVERLRLLAQATLGGRSISQAAGLSTRALTELTALPAPAGPAAATQPADAPSSAASLLDAAVSAIARFDAVGLELLLRRGTVALSAPAFLDRLVVPLAERVDVELRAGALRPAHRHLAHAVLRRILDHVTATASWPLAGPDLVVATPSGQPHELGALVTAAAAAIEGWRVTYLGAGLPAEDVAEAVSGVGAPAVMLGLSAAPGGRAIPRELRRLRELLPTGVAILVEGAAAEVHRKVLDEISATAPRDLEALRAQLRALGAARAPDGLPTSAAVVRGTAVPRTGP